MPPTSSELISAVGHPLRRRIIRAYLDGSVECPSAGELATALDERVGQVAYHLKTLAKCDLLRPVQGGNGQEADAPHYGWALGVDPDWLLVILEVWSESDVSR
jgi:DNA-binding transcriptional ArsR family regulator